jgi:hypothetical protein
MYFEIIQDKNHEGVKKKRSSKKKKKRGVAKKEKKKTRVRDLDEPDGTSVASFFSSATNIIL